MCQPGRDRAAAGASRRRGATRRERPRRPRVGDRKPDLDGRSGETAGAGYFKAEWTEAGDLAISWVRRSCAGRTWLSGTDTLVGEESETYSIVIDRKGTRLNSSH